MPNKIILTQEQINTIINAYVNLKESAEAIGNWTETSKPFIIKILKENNVEIRKPGRQDTGFDKKLYDKEYTEKNKEKKNRTQREWVANNRARNKSNNSKWRDENRESINDKSREWQSIKRQDGVYRFKSAITTGVWETLKTNRTTSIWSYMPYSLKDLIAHLENLFTPGMSWENYGEWHIDHIKPQSKFIFSDFKDEEFLKCWALTNLQPLWATTREIDGIIYQGNLNKNDKYVDTTPAPKFDIKLSGNTFHSTIPVVKENSFERRRISKLLDEEKERIGELYLTNSFSIEQLALDFKIGKKKVKDVLKEKNIQIRSKGHEPTHNTEDANKLYKELVAQKPDEGKMFVLICKTTGKMFKDYLNKSGAISNHLLKGFDIKAPNNHFKKQYFLKNGKHWFSDYFDLKQIDYFGN